MKHSIFARGGARKGFSLIELIVTIAIMAVLVAVLTPALLSYVERSRAQKDESAMGEVTNAITLALSDEEIYDELYECASSTGEIILPIIRFENDNNSFKMKEAVVTNYSNTKLEDLGEGKLAQRLEDTIGESVNLTSRTHRTEDFTVTVDFGTAANEMAVSVSGAWAGASGGSNSGSDPIATLNDETEYWVMIDGTKVYLEQCMEDPSEAHYTCAQFGAESCGYPIIFDGIYVRNEDKTAYLQEVFECCEYYTAGISSDALYLNYTTLPSDVVTVYVDGTPFQIEYYGIGSMGPLSLSRDSACFESYMSNYDSWLNSSTGFYYGYYPVGEAGFYDSVEFCGNLLYYEESGNPVITTENDGDQPAFTFVNGTHFTTTP